MDLSALPRIIQGGMGAGVSNWNLARTVAMLGQLGVVSGTATDLLIARRLQDGDFGGHIRRALKAFPFPKMAQRVLDTYWIPEGRKSDQPYKLLPMHTKNGPRSARELCIVANFVEVFLAKENHDGIVGINFLEKIQLPHLPSIYGAMLAGVTVIIMGAGIPREVPGVINAFVNHQTASYPLKVTGALPGDDTRMVFDPREYMEGDLPPLDRPLFFPIVSSNTLALTLAKKANGRVDGFIIEGPTAGGHNAPPRGTLKLNEKGEPVYGDRDIVDLAQMRRLGLPFWLAGSYGGSGKLRAALDAGAAGIQVGTAFAFCEESGMAPEYRRQLVLKALAGDATVFTDPVASPTGYPFKVALCEGTMSDPEIYLARQRICDLGYLRESYRKDDGTIGYRCCSEPIDIFVAKGGTVEATVGKKCLCNALMSNISLGQVQKGGYHELPLITCGDYLTELARFSTVERPFYTAKDVIDMLLQGVEDAAPIRQVELPYFHQVPAEELVATA